MARQDIETIYNSFPEQCHGCKLQRGCLDILPSDRGRALRRAQMFGGLAARANCTGVNPEMRPEDDIYIVGGDCSFTSDMASAVVRDANEEQTRPFFDAGTDLEELRQDAAAADITRQSRQEAEGTVEAIEELLRQQGEPPSQPES